MYVCLLDDIISRVLLKPLLLLATLLVSIFAPAVEHLIYGQEEVAAAYLASNLVI
jgi:hypothetical protein